ncbi:FAD-dependent oxidoreductase [Polymorphospora sp. NPDC050346]|uniref:NAD(P)/FAD-dependent oxidoreductase n=1 Tax=Polymorphospora sp. NPDC050346 TaxID=3155780 RepID=UPI0033C53399
MTVVVVGAGISGLACAGALAAAGIPVEVLDRARVTGGRMATRRLDGRPVDLGAAYFTTGDPAFAAVAERWRAAGLARSWTDTFAVYDPDGRHDTTGPVRWAAPAGLRSLPEELAAGLPAGVTTGRTVTRVGPGPTVDGAPAEAVVLAMPGPQAARLLDPALATAARAAAARRWLPALAVVLRYPARTWAGFAGAFVNGHPVLATVCDDGDRRGDGAPVLVAHTTAGFAREHLADPAAAGPPVAAAVRDLLELPGAAVGTYVHRWAYARPEPGGDDGAYHLDDELVGLAGDAFGRPGVPTAWASGDALGRALAGRLRAA